MGMGREKDLTGKMPFLPDQLLLALADSTAERCALLFSSPTIVLFVPFVTLRGATADIYRSLSLLFSASLGWWTRGRKSMAADQRISGLSSGVVLLSSFSVF